MGHMLGITNIWTYVIGTVAIVLLPGPNSMFVLSVAARRGVRAGYAGACGVFIGDAVLMTLSAAGVASLLRAEPALFTVVKYAGAAYLCWIGIGMLRGAWRRWRRPVEPADEPAASIRTAEERSPFRRALVISLLNPKATLFFVSFFIQFVQPGYPHAWLSFLVLGAIAELVSAAYLTTLIFTGSYLATQFRRRRKLATALTTGVAAVFVGFAVKLATASLT
ncbi:leucine efflux protein LeuE [Planosporangium flavigriseum]|uniref:Leucine efflux protein n=1 Tax=Planosporangium flavigriseum TaxID=373681 RepID=A0A8J3PNE5_9ACTN|nr:leucine efflux protein LeuE [Planosporangium flavigriseum]NJC67294.1 leucine efflux protein LeuE [Planosporangium flavigriseum]GIG75259.1 leucine efflux protein [Planosporangium flavigriseum]